MEYIAQRSCGCFIPSSTVPSLGCTETLGRYTFCRIWLRSQSSTCLEHLWNDCSDALELYCNHHPSISILPFPSIHPFHFKRPLWKVKQPVCIPCLQNRRPNLNSISESPKFTSALNFPFQTHSASTYFGIFNTY